MSQRNAVIRRLTAVETLGCTQVICSDKTGTLTQNKMTVVDHLGETELVAKAMALCSDANLNENDQAEVEPTECALVNFACSVGLKKQDLEKATPRVDEAPFDSGRKMMSTVHDLGGSYVQYTKGGPDVVLARCAYYYENGENKPMTEQKRAEIMAANKAMADKALRVLACAMKEYDALPADVEPESIENELVFIGLTGMIDPVRPEVKDAVDKCRDAGIRAVMITGDHIDTAIAIARDLGLLTEPNQAIMGSRLDDLTDEELDMAIEHYSVYARVQPEHKVRIVDAWKRKGKIVAMTGDGVNDAPSIKAADIGVGMGITGTDVTKNVADMILADDNFATIVSAVEEGRRIYANIRKAIQFLLSSNLSEVIAIFTATMLGFTILKPAHILWINLITDSLPALALGMEPGEADSMKRKPRSSKAGVFAGGVGGDIAYQGFFVALITLIAFAVGHAMENGVMGFANCNKGMTMAFLTMSMAEIFQSFNMRSRRGSIFTMKTTNWWLWGAAAAAFLLTLLVLYVPFLRGLFGFEPVALGEFGIAFGLAFLIIPLVELVKLIQRLTGHGEKDEEEKENSK
ncbi:MAG: cation-translocating P-type ATPase, partial [Clostridia bacterium]|nr:cation-translocating P-type ATPase [Clostridia bacterium]